MKYFRFFAVLLLFILLVTAGLSFFMPASQKLERSISITAPVSDVYKQIALLGNFNKWSVWSRADSSAINTITGPDGAVGAVNTWKGDPGISGQGSITIEELVPNQKIVQAIRFISPKNGRAHSTFYLSENNGVTTVEWSFELETPRPWNIFNIFSSMDKQLGKDFEDGLSSLKLEAEKRNGTASASGYSPEPLNFPATRFAMIRQQVKMTDIMPFFSQHLPLLYSETQKAAASPGAATGFYYSWDMKNGLTDMAAALPVSAKSTIPSPIIQMVDLPASKAVVVNFRGSYERIRDAYSSLDEYVHRNNLKQKMPVIEQYISGPANEKDSSKWLTKILYLVE